MEQVGEWVFNHPFITTIPVIVILFIICAYTWYKDAVANKDDFRDGPFEI